MMSGFCGLTGMKHLSAGFLILFLSLTALSQQTNERPLPRFESYPAIEKFRGKKAQLVLERGHPFRTRMREVYSHEPNFAGHYILGSWGCGAPCQTVIIFDANTGREIDGIRVSAWAGSATFPCSIDEPLDYRLNSRLLIVYGSLDDQKTGIYYFVMGSKGLKLIKSIEDIEQLKKHPGCHYEPT
jgi:hypothetical protein